MSGQERGDERPARVLVYLHGHGSDPGSIHPFYRERRDDGWMRVCPAGRVAVDGGRAWFADGPRGADPVSLESAIVDVCAVIDAAVGELGLDRSAVVLGGFSQGAATALAVAARLGAQGGVRLGGLLVQAGFVPEAIGHEVEVSATAARSVLVQHPVDDDVVPSFMGEDLSASLGAASGVGEVELQLLPGGHAVSPQMVEASAAWLAAR